MFLCTKQKTEEKMFHKKITTIQNYALSKEERNIFEWNNDLTNKRHNTLISRWCKTLKCNVLERERMEIFLSCLVTTDGMYNCCFMTSVTLE